MFRFKNPTFPPKCKGEFLPALEALIRKASFFEKGSFLGTYDVEVMLPEKRKGEFFPGG
jgi:hypothetical protein